jgi:hypothetical protein
MTATSGVVMWGRRTLKRSKVVLADGRWRVASLRRPVKEHRCAARFARPCRAVLESPAALR